MFYLHNTSLFIKVIICSSFYLKALNTVFEMSLLWNNWISMPLCLKSTFTFMSHNLPLHSATRSTQIDFLSHTQKIVSGSVEWDGNGRMGCDGSHWDPSGILNSNYNIELQVYYEINLCRLCKNSSITTTLNIVLQINYFCLINKGIINNLL